MKKNLIISFLCIISITTFGQLKTDSLQRQLQNTEGVDKAKTYNELFKAYINTSPYEAIDYAHKALETAAEIPDQKGIAAALNNLGIAYKNQGVYDKALDYYLRSLRLSTKLDEPFMVASTLNNIGTVYSLKGLYDKALIYFIESLESFEKQQKKEPIIGALNNIGNAYLENGREDKALEYYRRSIVLCDELNKKEATYDPLNNIANIHFLMENYNKAIPLYQQTFDIAHSSNNGYGQALSALNLGVTYLKQKRLNNAEGELQAALYLANKTNSPLLLMDIHGALSELYYAQKKYKEAYEALIIQDKYEDQLHNEEGILKIAQMEAAIAFEEKEKEIEVLRKQSEIDRLIIDNNRIVIMISLMGAILLVAVGFIIYILKKEKAITFYR